MARSVSLQQQHPRQLFASHVSISSNEMYCSLELLAAMACIAIRLLTFMTGNLNGATVTQQGEPGVIVQQGGSPIVQQLGGASPIVQNVRSPVVQSTAPPASQVVQPTPTVVQQPTYPVSPPVPVPPPGLLLTSYPPLQLHSWLFLDHAFQKPEQAGSCMFWLPNPSKDIAGE